MSLRQLLCLTILLASCNTTAPRLECATSSPDPATVPQWLARCLPAHASAADARRLLETWQLIQPESTTSWGGTQAVDVLPSAGDELVMVYYPKLSEVTWNPQGKLIVLAHTQHADQWKPVFDADTLELAHSADGTVWRNWSYWPIMAQDLTGDGKLDLLLRAEYYNGHHTIISRVVALSAQGSGPQPLHVVLNADNLEEGATYQMVSTGHAMQLQSVHAVGSSAYLTRNFIFDGAALSITSENLDAPYAMAQLIQTLHSKPVPPDSVEVQQAYALVASAWSHSVGQPVPHPDERVLAEILLLQLEQIALINRENGDPKVNADPQSVPYQQYMRAATRRNWIEAMKSAQPAPHAGELYAVIQAAGQLHQQNRVKHICDAIQFFVSLHSDWLTAMNRAAHGAAQIHAVTVCVA